MAGSTISSTITHTVTIGSTTYLSPLTITNTGLIEPLVSSTTTLHFENFNETFAGFGVSSTISNPYLDNLGVILGATAASFTDVGQTIGGYGVYFEYGGTVSNAGTIRGGAGRYGKGAVGFNDVGTVINTGLLIGGYGSFEAGPGVKTYSGGDSAFNSGIILGGSGPDGAGDGMILEGGILTNNGTILGGNGLFSGIGVIFPAYTTILNNAVIRGGNGSNGGGGAKFDEEIRGVVIINSSLISGGYGTVSGGFGVVSSAGSLLNIGVIMGGSSQEAGGYGAAPGNYGQITNDGTILGGNATRAGGNGIGPAYDLFGPITNATIINNGLIRGGSGSIAGNGIYLYDGSTVTNHATIIGGYGSSSGNGILINKTSGFITGIGPKATNGVIINGAATDTSALILGNNGVEIQGTTTSSLINFASIVGRHDGVYIQQTVSTASIIINEASGVIIGNTYGVDIAGSSGTVINAGTIRGLLSRGVYLAAGGSVFNIGSTALISSGTGNGNDAGIRFNDSGYVMNQGTIRSPFTDGIILKTGGSINNTGSAALIVGHVNGVDVYNVAAATVTNSGTILAGSTVVGSSGVYLGAGGSVNNIASTALIAGDGYGVEFYYSSGTVTNAGTIAGGTDAIEFGGTGNNRLIVDAGAVFIGTVTASSSAINFLELAAETNASTGTLTGIGTQFTGFQTIGFDTGAKWRIEGSISGLGSGETINGFTIGDTIILDGFAATSDTYTSHGLVLGNGTSYVTLDITGSFSTANFDVVDPPAETTITVVCYLRGTKIATPAGERAIEALSIGDPVMTKFGGYRRIKWIGRQSYARHFIKNNFDQIPVKFTAGSLGPNLPKRELSVSPGHSMLIGGVLVLAKSLVNGITVTQYECPEQVDYFQLEFETHDCVLAEGVWAESYADTPGLRAKFHNAAAFYEMYPDHIEPETQSLCAPRPLEGPALETVLRPLIAQLRVRPGLLHGCIDEISPGLIRGWAWDEANPHLPVLLEIFAGGRVIGMILACDYRDDLAQAGIGRGHCSFTFAAKANLPMNLHVIIRRVQDHAEIRESARQNFTGLFHAAG